MIPADATIDDLTIRAHVATQMAAGLVKMLPGPHADTAEDSGPWRAWICAESIRLTDTLLAGLYEPSPAITAVRESLALLEGEPVVDWLESPEDEINLMAAADVVRRSRDLLRQAVKLLG